MTRTLTFVVPGDINTRTGGYEYDRQLITALRTRGWVVTLCQLGAGFPYPSLEERSKATLALRAIPDDTLVVIDGLAFGALPDVAAQHRQRLLLIALVHHPLGLETGLSAEASRRLLDSERQALDSARKVIVTSPGTRRVLLDQGLIVDPAVVIVPGSEPAALSSGSRSERVRLLCVASVVPRKGHDVLVRALSTLRDLPWDLACGGSLERAPDYGTSLQKLIQERGLHERVEFLGECSEAQLTEQYASADVFVLPSYYEGYGMVVAEAIARGLPVVATDTGGIAELVGEDAGIVVPPGDESALTNALRVMIGDTRARASFAAGARYRRSHLPSWDGAGAAMESVLLEVASR